MVAAHEIEHERDQRVVLRGVSWATYVSLRDGDGSSSNVRMTYLAGTLEVMSPSESHEEIKELIGRLIEAWSEEHDIDLRGFGSSTFRNEAAERGLEPDGCYVIGPKVEGAPPHLAIEVIVSNPLVDKLDVYAGLGVDEVWTWERDCSIAIHVRRGAKYERRERSPLLPRLDVVLLASFVRPGDSHVALVKAFRAAIRSRLTSE
jgi:Uma2 family endonuclease